MKIVWGIVILAQLFAVANLMLAFMSVTPIETGIGMIVSALAISVMSYVFGKAIDELMRSGRAEGTNAHRLDDTNS